MKEAEMWMKYSTLSETKSVSFKKEIAKNIEFLTEKVKLLDTYLSHCIIDAFPRRVKYKL